MRRGWHVFLVLIGLAGPAFAEDCVPTQGIHAHRIVGTVAGAQDFRQVLPNGWVFALLQAPHGWRLRVFDRAPIGYGADLTALTPPLRGPVNPRDLFGWHFRNAANDGPNTGDVNAPQDLRAIVISSGLAGTGGLRPPDGPVTSSPEDGIGWLLVRDKGLSDLNPGKLARMSYLSFEACLRWPKSSEERDAESLSFTEEDVEIFGACGLDLTRYELHAAITPRSLGGDFDGDGVLDQAAQIRRRSDGARGLALCRAGTRIDVIGMDGAVGLRPGYVGQMEAWRRTKPGGGDLAGIVDAPAWPELDGDALALERIEKELFLLYRKEGAWRSLRIYGRTEP